MDGELHARELSECRRRIRKGATREIPFDDHLRVAMCLLSRRFKQLDRVSVPILNLNLTSTRTGFHVISKGDASVLQAGDATWEIGDTQHNAVPPARLLTLTARHWP